jgi:hypothetical protein
MSTRTGRVPRRPSTINSSLEKVGKSSSSEEEEGEVEGIAMGPTSRGDMCARKEETEQDPIVLPAANCVISWGGPTAPLGTPEEPIEEESVDAKTDEGWGVEENDPPGSLGDKDPSPGETRGLSPLGEPLPTGDEENPIQER